MNSEDNGPTIPEARFLTAASLPEQYPVSSLPEIAFAGRSNVGKSSLMNVLLDRHNLVKVSRDPGRTRSINFFSAGERAVLVDLPGYGYAKVSKSIKQAWAPMIETYLLQREQLAAVVLLLDIRRTPGEEEKQMLQLVLERSLYAVLVATKADQVAPGQVASRIQSIADLLAVRTSWIVPFSRLSREGRGEIWLRLDSACRLWQEQHGTITEASDG
jgi:GTP-binding protein